MGAKKRKRVCRKKEVKEINEVKEMKERRVARRRRRLGSGVVENSRPMVAWNSNIVNYYLR